MRICDQCDSKDDVTRIVVKVENVYDTNPLAKPPNYEIVGDGISLYHIPQRTYSECERILELCDHCKDVFTAALADFMEREA